MAPLRSFEVSRRIAVSIDLDRTAARAWTKSFAPYFGVVAAVAPSLCMCLKGYCSPVTPLVELLNSLLGALRAFRSPIPLNVPGPLPSRRTAGERSFPSIPSFPWSAEDKLIPVVLERCYAPFTSAKVVLFLPLFSFSLPSIFESLWDVWASPSYFRCGWRPWAEKFFPGSFERIPTASTAPWTPLHVRSTAPWTRTRTSEKATFLLPVCTRNTYSALVRLFSIKTGCCLKKRAGHGRWRERNERKQLDLHVHTRGEVEAFFNDVTLTKCICGAPTLPDYISQSSGCQRQAKTAALENAWKSTQVILSDARQSFKPQSMWHR